MGIREQKRRRFPNFEIKVKTRKKKDWKSRRLGIDRINSSGVIKKSKNFNKPKMLIKQREKQQQQESFWFVS